MNNCHYKEKIDFRIVKSIFLNTFALDNKKRPAYVTSTIVTLR